MLDLSLGLVLVVPLGTRATPGTRFTIPTGPTHCISNE